MYPGFVITAMAAGSFGVLAATAAAQPHQVVPGEATTITVPLPTGARPAGSLSYKIEPARAIELMDPSTGSLTWDPATPRDLQLKFRLIVSPGTAPGPLVAARVAVRWPDGRRDIVDVRVQIRPATEGAAISGKDFEAELIPVPRAAAPGSAIRLLYTIYNYEETDERVRLRVSAGPGWTLLDPELERRERSIEAFDEIEGEIHLVLPDDAQPGERQLVRLLVEVVGEPGEIEARNYVSVVRRGGARPGVPTLSTTSTIGLSQLAASGLQNARTVGALTLSASFSRQSSISFSYDQGLRQNLSNFRYMEEPTRTDGNVRHAGWDVTISNRVSSPGHALAGPAVRGAGASVRRPTGRLITELVVAQPALFGGAASGHLVRGRTGLRTPKVTVAFSASDFGRPAGGYTTLPSVQVVPLDATAEEQLEIERRLTAHAPSNRVQGAGLDAELRPIRGHLFAVRAGSLRLTNAAGTQVSSPAAEAWYSFSAPQRATFNARFRRMPPTLQGIYIPGDEMSGDGSLRVLGDLRVVGRAYRTSSETLASDFFSSGEGGSAGLRYLRKGRRIEVRANHHDSQFTVRNVRRTISVLGGIPLGPLAFSANGDVGTQDNGTLVVPIAYYRGDLRWIRDGRTMSVSVSHSEVGSIRRERVDFITSLNIRELELAGGAWATRGYTFGGRPGMWTNVGLPVGHDFMITVGVDRSPFTWTSLPTWRGMLAVRKRFDFPLPFGQAAPVQGHPAETSR